MTALDKVLNDLAVNTVSDCAIVEGVDFGEILASCGKVDTCKTCFIKHWEGRICRAVELDVIESLDGLKKVFGITASVR